MSSLLGPNGAPYHMNAGEVKTPGKPTIVESVYMNAAIMTLNVDAAREFLTKYPQHPQPPTNDQILHLLHHARMQHPHLPEKVKRESELWLRARDGYALPPRR